MGGAVPPEHLVGRDTLVDQLAGWLTEGFRVLLTGPRRCGKSSVATAVAARVRALGVPVALVDLAACSTLRQAAERVTQACNLWVRGAATVAAADAGAEAAFVTALQDPERLAAHAGTEACALVLDGCDHLERLGGMQALRRARPALARQQRTGYLLTGSHTLPLARLAGTRSAPFALPIGMHPPQIGTWTPYLQERFASIACEVDPAALTYVVERVGGHPFDLMAVCRACAATGRRGRPVSVPSMTRAVREAGALLAPLVISEAMGLGPVHHGILTRMACGAHIYREAGPPASIKRAMDELVAGGILRRSGRGEYRFTEPLMAEVLRGDLP